MIASDLIFSTVIVITALFAKLHSPKNIKDTVLVFDSICQLLNYLSYTDKVSYFLLIFIALRQAVFVAFGYLIWSDWESIQSTTARFWITFYDISMKKFLLVYFEISNFEKKILR